MRGMKERIFFGLVYDIEATRLASVPFGGRATTLVGLRRPLFRIPGRERATGADHEPCYQEQAGGPDQSRLGISSLQDQHKKEKDVETP